MTDDPLRSTHLALIARWCLDAATFPTTPDEIEAVARLRFDQLVRLPTAEREALFRLLALFTPHTADLDRQKGPVSTWH